jgi:hypothetical protein
VPPPLLKFPRTPHLEGSRFQPGDEGLAGVPFAEIAGKPLLVTEKLDGANAGLRFDAQGKLWLQSRGHFLTGGTREKHFNLFKRWGAAVGPRLWPALGARFALYGEWLYAKHTIFYDRLPHYFLAFDVLDTETDEFLSRARSEELLEGVPVALVPALHLGPVGSRDDLLGLVGPSLFKGPQWRDNLLTAAAGAGVGAEQANRETDPTDLMEGLYVKVEEQGRVAERCKFVRGSFLQAVEESNSHWLRRPIVPNGLAEGVDLFGGPS